MPIALLTDFGTADGYVGALKGVLARLAPKVPVFDIAHDLPPFDIIQANLTLYRAYRYFPHGTIFVVVVDPGVGGGRKPLLVETKNYFFIGPDNGIFTMALAEEKILRFIELQNKKYFLPDVSFTFHGRDIFAPVAAHLAQGVSPMDFGPTLKDCLRIPEVEPKISSDYLEGRIIGVDRFGNIVTNFKKSFLKKFFPKFKFSVSVGAQLIAPLQAHYSQGKPGVAIILFGSADLLEIAVNQGSAASQLGIKIGDPVKIKLHRLGRTHGSAPTVAILEKLD